MNKLNLDHALTFPELHAKNEALDELLSQQDPDSEQLLLMVTQRDELILSYITRLESDKKKRFIEAELACNKLIEETVRPLLNDTEALLKQVVRGRKAVRKYKK